MQRYEIFEMEDSVSVLIGTSADLNQACLAAWSRAKRNVSYTYVLDNQTGTVVDEYDYVHVQSDRQRSYIDQEIDYA
jgi:uncharacterized protein (UPF0333 family)